MTLQRAVFFVIVGLYVVSMLSALGMLIGIGINFFSSMSVNAFPLAIVFFGCLVLRLALIVWLRRLGGVPQEFQRK